jgi:hypothetical protein
MASARIVRHRLTSLSLLTFAGLTALSAPVSAAPAAPASSAASAVSAEQVTAVRDLRAVGNAMARWYQTEVQPQPPSAVHILAARGPVDISKIPVIASADLAKLLVPRFISAVPEADPWGQPYEYRLRAEAANGEPHLAARSAGPGGQLSSAAYVVGGFLPKDAVQDIVYVDRALIRWPVAGAAGNDDPVVLGYEVSSIDMARIPEAPRHRDDFLRLMHDGSILFLRYGSAANLTKMTPEEVEHFVVGVAVQRASALRLSDRLMIMSRHRVDFRPNDPEEVIEILPADLTFGELKTLLAPYGEVTIR